MQVVDEVIAAFNEIAELPYDKILTVGDDVMIPTFEKSTVLELCDIVISILKLSPMLIYVTAPVVVVGDLHGNFHDLLRIIKRCGSLEESQYLFLGDYVDRGGYSTETIIILLAMYAMNSNNMVLLRGNHEFPHINEEYGFREEIISLYGDDEVWTEINRVFSYLPIAAVIDDEVFCVHGGLSPEFKSLESIYGLQAPLTWEKLPDFVKDMLWADPFESHELFADGLRGCGVGFGFDAIFGFLKQINMKLIIRAHEHKMDGYDFFGKKCITVFSTSGYSDNNTAAVMTMMTPDIFKFEQFPPIIHPKREYARFFTMKKYKLDSSKLSLCTSCIMRSYTNVIKDNSPIMVLHRTCSMMSRMPSQYKAKRARIIGNKTFSPM